MKDNKLVEIKKKADEIKALYDNYLKFKEQKFSYTPLDTKDGTPMFIDEGAELAIGIPCYHMDENGQPMPCEDATYELTDGRTVTVVDGVIAEIADSMEPGTESPEETAAPSAQSKEKMADDMPPNAEDVEDTGAGMEERMVAIEQTCEKMMEMLQGLMAKYEEDLSKVSQQMNKLIITSSDEISRAEAKKDSVNSKMSKEDFMNDLKTYANLRGLEKAAPRPQTFGTTTNFDKAAQLADIRKLMSDARSNGGLGSIIPASN